MPGRFRAACEGTLAVVAMASAHAFAAAGCAYLLTVSPASAACLLVVALDAWARAIPRGPRTTALLVAGGLLVAAAARGNPLGALGAYVAVATADVATLRWLVATRVARLGADPRRERVQVALWIPAFAFLCAFVSAVAIVPLFLLAVGYHAPLGWRIARAKPGGALGEADETRLVAPARQALLAAALVWCVTVAVTQHASHECRVSDVGGMAAGRAAPDARDSSAPGTSGAPLRLAILGDSSPYGFVVPDRASFGRRLERDTARLGDTAARWAGVRVINCAFPSAELDDLAAQAARALHHRPDAFLVYAGVRERLVDPATGVGLSERYARIVRALASTGRPVLVTTYPVALLGPEAQDVAARNDAIRAAARTTGAELVDLAAELRCLGTIRACFTVDVVHPNVLGHARLATRVGDALRGARLQLSLDTR